jgi:group I intron endonuclease
MEMKHQLYKITNKLNGKYYIGVHTGDIFKDNYWGSGTIIKESIEKHGKENFEREVIKQLNNKKEIYKLESEIVNEEFVKNQQTYNVAFGGTGGNLGTIVNKKISDQMKGDKHMYYGKKRPEHTKWLLDNSPMRGKTHSDETKHKIRNSVPNSKKVIQYSKNGDFIREWDTTNQAAKELGIGHVHTAAKGLRKTAGGFIWKYKTK